MPEPFMAFLKNEENEIKRFQPPYSGVHQKRGIRWRTVRPDEQFQLRMRDLIEELREAEELSYQELANRLEANGMRVDAKVLANRVHRGRFSAGFALALLQALRVTELSFPSPVKRLKVPR